MQRALLEDFEIHEKFRICELRLASGGTCGAYFDSPIGLIKHLRASHGFPKIHSPLIVAVMELKGPLFASQDGERRVFLKMAPYKKDKFCILHVVEYKFWVRIWATEADPSVDPEEIVPIKIIVPSPRFDQENLHLHQFRGKILPFGKYSFQKNDPVEYFDVPKNFVQQFCKRRDNGRFGLKIQFAIGEFDAQERKDDGEEVTILQISEEDISSSSDEGSQDGSETNATVSSGFGDDDDDDEVIVRPFYEVYD